MHLPHKAILDKARDLRVLIFSADSCSKNDSDSQRVKVEGVATNRRNTCSDDKFENERE